MATLQNERDKSLQATVPRLVATTIVIASTGALFTKPNAVSAITPATITLTGTTTVFTTPIIKWYYASNKDMVWHDFNITGTNIGANRVLTSADFITQLGTKGTKVFYKATAEQTGFTSSESPLFEITYDDLTAAVGADGEDAYHIRLDNESRIIRFDYTGNAIAGQLPATAQVYITSGATDVTVGSGYITYSIHSVSGATASINSSTGLVTVTAISQDTNWVNIQAIIDEPTLPAITVYKKLYLYKFEEASTQISIEITQDHYYYAYANAASTTNTAAWSTTTFTAIVSGIPGAVVTWSAKTYNASGVEIAGTETIFSFSDNKATVTDVQFLTRGGVGVRTYRIFATYNNGGSSVTDYADIERHNADGTTGTRRMHISDNNRGPEFGAAHTNLTAENDGTVTSGTLASKAAFRVQIIDTSSDTFTDDTNAWSFTATPSTGIVVSINGTGNGPYVAGSPVVLRITSITTTSAIPGQDFTGTITVLATKGGSPPNVSGIINITVEMPAVSGAVLDITRDSTIILPVDKNGVVTSYAEALRTVKVLNGAEDVTAGWTLGWVDGPGVTSTLVDGILQVSDFQPVSASLNVTDKVVISRPNTESTATQNLAHNGSNTIVYVVTHSPVSAPRAYVSTDSGSTWSSNLLPTPPVSYSHISSATIKNFIYAKGINKFVYLYANPVSSGNGRIAYSSDGINWIAQAIPSTTLGYGSYVGIFQDSVTNIVYINYSNTSRIFYSSDLINWTTATPSTTISGTADASVNGFVTGYNGKFVRSDSARAISYSTNLTSWSSIATLYHPNTTYTVGDLRTVKDVFVSTVPYTSTIAILSSKGTPNAQWKTTGRFTNTSVIGDRLLCSYGDSIIFSDGNFGVYITYDQFTSVSRMSISPIGVSDYDVPVASATGGQVFKLNSNWMSLRLGQEVMTYNGNKFIPILAHVAAADALSSAFYRAYITAGNNGNESYITVTATSNDPEQGRLTGIVVVRKGVYVGDVYSLIVNPGTIVLPSTSDGVVYPSSFTNNTNVATYSLLKNGVPYTGAVSGSITASTGITAAVAGGTPSGTITVQAMTTAATDGTITGVALVDGVDGVVLEILIKVVKLKDGIIAGPKEGATVSGYSSNQTHIGIRFNPAGTFDIKYGSGGSYVLAGTWYVPVNATVTPGSSYYINVSGTSDTGDTLRATGGTPATTTDAWFSLSSTREYYLANAASGAHRVSLRVRIGTSSTGDNAVIGRGELELLVP